jgi:hypothetical protein
MTKERSIGSGTALDNQPAVKNVLKGLSKPGGGSGLLASMANLIKIKGATAQPEPQGEKTPTGGRNMVRSMAFQRKKKRMDPIRERPEDEINSGRFDPNQQSTSLTELDGTPEDTDGVAVATFAHGVPKLNLKMTKAPLYQHRGDSDMSKSKSRSKSCSGIRNQFLCKAIL